VLVHLTVNTAVHCSVLGFVCSSLVGLASCEGLSECEVVGLEGCV